MPDAPETDVRVHGVQEEYFYMMVHPCLCGGAWASHSQTAEETSGQVVHRVAAKCFRCGKEQAFRFRLDAPGGSKVAIREVNPTTEPSCALDAAEWMQLARFYLGRIERLKKPAERAQSLLDARQCLEEALKFYGPGDDDPPPEALWSEKSRKALAHDRAAFRRAAIEAMLEKIPPAQRLRQADAMEQKEFDKAVENLARERRRKWWQFWKRN